MKTCETYLKEVKERVAKATPGPWDKQTDAIVSIHSGTKYDLVFDAGIAPYRPTLQDLEFIAKSRTDTEILIKMVECAREALETCQASAAACGKFLATKSVHDCAIQALAELDRLAGEVK